MREFFEACISPSIRWRAIKVSLVVGTLLNLINQADSARNGGSMSWPHRFLNYLVPYCVSNYSAAEN